MTTTLLAMATVVMEAIWIFVAASSPGPYWLRKLVVVNLMMVAMFAPKLMNIGGYVTNITSIMYAGAFAIQMILLQNYGRDKAYRTIESVAFSMAALFTLSYLIYVFPAVEDGHHFSEIMAAIVKNMTHVIIASVTSFIIATVTMIEIYSALEAKNKVLAFVAGLTAGQAIDSLLFFAVAFHDWPTSEQVEFIITGFVLKVIIGLIYVPLISCASKRISSRGYN